jgi:hypothetical protein
VVSTPPVAVLTQPAQSQNIQQQMPSLTKISNSI